MLGGNPVALSKIKVQRPAMSRSEDHRPEAASSEVSVVRRLSCKGRRALQWRMACSKGSGSVWHLGQVAGMSRLYQEGWASR